MGGGVRVVVGVESVHRNVLVVCDILGLWRWRGGIFAILRRKATREQQIRRGGAAPSWCPFQITFGRIAETLSPSLIASASRSTRQRTSHPMKYVAVATQLLALHADAYTLVATPPAHGRNALSVRMDIATDVKRTAKSVTGSSFLPPEAIERAKEGNPIEKAKLAKDGTEAWTVRG